MYCENPHPYRIGIWKGFWLDIIERSPVTQAFPPSLLQSFTFQGFLPAIMQVYIVLWTLQGLCETGTWGKRIPFGSAQHYLMIESTLVSSRDSWFGPFQSSSIATEFSICSVTCESHIGTKQYIQAALECLECSRLKCCSYRYSLLVICISRTYTIVL